MSDSGPGGGSKRDSTPPPNFCAKLYITIIKDPLFCSTFNLLPTLLMCHHSHYTGTYITDIRIQSNFKKIKLIRIHTHKYFKAFWIKKDSVIPLNLKTWTDERHTYHVCINVYINFSTINIIIRRLIYMVRLKLPVSMSFQSCTHFQRKITLIAIQEEESKRK